jgi:uncharacterized glyoxalase superfamily protein PhnB
MLSVRRGAQAVDFYKKAFGARELFRLDGDGGSVVAQLTVGEAEFWVADESPEHKNFSPESLGAEFRGAATVRMVMVVDDPDAVFKQAVDAGARTCGAGALAREKSHGGWSTLCITTMRLPPEACPVRSGKGGFQRLGLRRCHGRGFKPGCSTSPASCERGNNT